jgi:hypothetical protein
MSRNWVTAIAVSVGLLAPAAGVAQDAPAAAAETPDPAAIAEGDRLIATVNGQAFFRNDTAGKGVILRHTPSGLVCIMTPGRAGNQLTVFPGSPPGDDVACESDTIIAHQTFYATRAPADATLDKLFAMAVLAMKMRSPEAKPFKPAKDGELLKLFGDKLPAQRSAVYKVKAGYTRVSVALVNGWELKARISSPEEAGAGALGELTWVGALAQAAYPKIKP